MWIHGGGVEKSAGGLGEMGILLAAKIFGFDCAV